MYPVSITTDVTGNQLGVNSDGSLTVQPSNTVNTTPWLEEKRSSTIATYSATAGNLASATLATDIFVVGGSATKTIKILKFSFTGTQTTAGNIFVEAIKRTSADSGGTSSAFSLIAHDSNNANATATVTYYSANPSLGSGTQIFATRLFVPGIASVSQADPWTVDLQGQGQPLVLRGTAQQLAISLNATTIAGGSFTFNVMWTEE